MFQFDEKRVIVTGGSRGIGAEITKQFAARGAKVAIFARNLEKAQEFASTVDGQVAAYGVDVADEEQVNEAFAAVIEEWGGVDILINNAGITQDKLVMAMKGDDWDRVMDINLKGTFLCSRAALRPMIRNRAGRIVNITSVVGLTGNPGQGNYSASKAGVVGFTKSLAKEIATRSVTVNAIAPGMIDTEMTQALNEDQQKAILQMVPQARFGSSAEVAAAALFLSSDEASYVTGEVLRVDGGMAM